MHNSALLDHRGQAERFGAALRGIWREYCRPSLDTGAGRAA